MLSRSLLALVMLAIGANAQVVIRMGTLAPKDSRWHKILIEMGEEWKKASNGKVELRIYPGGEQGDEPAMVQKMRIKKLQSVALSGAGLSGIDPDVAALQIPLMIESWDELDYVRDHVAERLEKGLAQRGFVVLNWADTGWVHFFTKKPASHPDEIRKMKLCVLQGDNSTFELYKANGFHPEALAATDIMTGLQTGLIDAFQSPALVALSSQWFGGAKNMLDIKFTPLVGATLVSKDVWEQIPAATRTQLMAAAQKAGVELRGEIRKLEESSVGLMQTLGLNVVKADPTALAEWRKLVDGIYPSFRGQVVPADLFDQVRSLRDEYRKKHGPAHAALSAHP